MKEMETTGEASILETLRSLVPRLDSASAEVAEDLQRQIEAQVAGRRRDDDHLRELAVLVDQVRDAVLIHDLGGRICLWNKGAQQLCGWSAEEVIGKTLSEIGVDGSGARLDEIWRSLIEDGQWTGEVTLRTKDQQEVHAESRRLLIRDEECRPQSVLVINTDVTERRKIEGQLLRAQRTQSLGAMAGGVAHDINNVLTPILMAVLALRARVTDQASQRLLTIIQRNAERGADMVRQVLEFAKGVEGKRIVLQPKHLVKEIVRTLKGTLPEAIQIECSMADDTWPVTGDATQLHQVLVNLCVNARDAMPEGGRLTIKISNVELGGDGARSGQFVVITVGDTGAGIPPEVRDRIFEPFFTTKDPGKGTGLGLSTVAEIVRSHGGFVDLESERGLGTRFHVYLPASTSPPEGPAVEDETAPPRGNGELVLVVDDEPPMLEVARFTLESFGYAVVTAASGEEALDIYRRHKDLIKVVLVDMVMPDMDGASTICGLEQIDPSCKIIATTGMSIDERASEAARVGARAFLAKPFKAERLLRALRELLTEN
jgi:PAS domain S-box-containing protein